MATWLLQFKLLFYSYAGVQCPLPKKRKIDSKFVPLDNCSLYEGILAVMAFHYIERIGF